MRIKPFLWFLVIFLTLPVVNAQVLVSSHNITYELREGEVLIQEDILFVNPLLSEVHTFDEDIVLLREGPMDLSISGVPSHIDNETSPNKITLQFSKSPIFRPPTINFRLVTLTYKTPDFTSETDLDEDMRVNVFSGNTLLSLPSAKEVGETLIKIKPAQNLQLGLILPETDVRDRGVTYFMSGDDRKIYTAFIVEIQYAKFKDKARSNIEVIKENLDNSKSRVEDVKSSILNAKVYDANTTNAQEDLDASVALIEEAQNHLALTEAFFEYGEFYSAYLLSNTSVHLSERAIEVAIEAGREANLQHRIALNDLIAQLENVTATPPQTTVPEKEVDEKEILETPPPTNLTVPPSPPPLISEPVEREGFPKAVALIFLIVFIAVVGYLLLSKNRKRKDRQAAVKDFRAIADLKRKSYKGFEEKVVDVKKETNIAGEIRKLGQEKKKFQLGVENLNKKRVAGEIDEKVYQTEKSKYEGIIKKLNKKITALEKELPKKGGSDEKGSSDRPKKGR
jgi:hypothetical protein